MINVNNSNYLWVHYTGTGIKELNLIDSGAQVSVIPKKLYDKISEKKRTPLMTAAVDIKAGNGSSIKCYGMVTLCFNFQDMDFKYNFYVVEDNVQAILGYDFMRDTGDWKIIPSTNSVTIRGKKLELVRNDKKK